MAYKTYRVLKTRILGNEVMANEGDIVYDQKGYDYGLSSDDTRWTGIEHVSVTLNSDGSYPGFTIALSDLKEVQI